MYRKIYILLILLFFVFLSCNSKIGIQAIDLNNQTDVSINNFFEPVKIIQLETTDESLIGTISQIIKYDDKVFILDIKTQSVFCFKIDGSFLFKINKVGRGPDEYNLLDCICIDTYNNVLLLLDPFGALLSYTFDGNFISKTMLPLGGTAYNEVYAINADTLVFQSLNDFQILYYSKEENAILKKLYHVLDNRVFSNLYKTYYYNDSVFFCSIPNYEVVNLSDTSQKITFKWDFGENNNSESDIEKAQNYRKEMIAKERFREVFNYIDLYLKSFLLANYESNKYRYASVQSKGKTYDVFIEKATNKQYVFTETHEGLSFKRAYISNGYFITSSELLKEHNPNGDFLTVVEKIAPEYSDIVKNHNPAADNPFLILYKLKNE